MTAKYVIGIIVMCYRFSNMRYDPGYTLMLAAYVKSKEDVFKLTGTAAS